MAKKRVILFGGGLAALSAGIHLLQEGGADRFDVTAICMEHRLGGKAASWRHPDGRYMEIGFHAVFGYYTAIQRLLERGGHPVTDPRFFTPNEGEHLMYEASARAVNRLDVPQGPGDIGAILNNGFFGYEGMSILEKAEAGAWMARIGAELALTDVDPEIDEHGFTAYCISKGLPRAITQKTWFRYVLDLCFNFPATGSAYVGIYGFQRLMGLRNSTVHYLNGPLSEVIVAPIARLFTSLGGKIQFCTKVCDVQLDPTTHTLERFSTRPMATPVPIADVVDHVNYTPIGGSYSLEDAPYPVGDPAPATSGAPSSFVRGTDFDYVVWTLPIDSTRSLLRTSPNFRAAVLEQPQLRDIWSLRTVASTSLRLWLREKVMPPSYSTVVMGTPQPAATTIDYSNRVSELQNQTTYGSVIELEGQEGLHAELTDEEIVRESLEQLRTLPFIDSAKFDVDSIISGSGGDHVEFRRNTAHHVRYILMERGHWKYRPDQEKTPYDNLVFAGDWVKSTQPTASMEAAVRTGKVAANLLRDREGLPEAQA